MKKNELLLKQKETHLRQKDNVKTIKRILSSKNIMVNNLLDQIAAINAPTNDCEITHSLDNFFKRHHIVRGHIKAASDFAENAELGLISEFKVTDISYLTYRGVFEENNLTRASIALCKQLYAYFLLLTPTDVKYNKEFHKKITEQFSEQWKKISWELNLKFEAITEDIESIETLFSLFDLALQFTAKNNNEEENKIIIPGQPLVVYLSQKSGTDYNNESWLED